MAATIPTVIFIFTLEQGAFMCFVVIEIIFPLGDQLLLKAYTDSTDCVLIMLISREPPVPKMRSRTSS